MSPEEIKQTRLTLGMTYEQFAKAAGCSLRTVYNWEGGEAQPKGLYLQALLKLKRKADRQEKIK